MDNPVYYALVTGNSDKAEGSNNVKYFPPEISPFAGFAIELQTGFNELYETLPANRKILFASRDTIPLPDYWKLIQHVAGYQFVYAQAAPIDGNFEELKSLNGEHIEAMMSLAALTKPGPFAKRTIEFGNYYGIFSGKKLIAMTGRRLAVFNHIEVSAVCTHPGYLGKGYAAKLVSHQVNSILAENRIPFLHVRCDNNRAISLYERLGFQQTGDMHFYLLQKD